MGSITEGAKSFVAARQEKRDRIEDKQNEIEREDRAHKRKIEDEERILGKDRKKNKLLAKSSFGDILEEDKINELADAGADLDDIRQAASVAKDLRSQGREERMNRLQTAVQKREMAKQQGFSTNFTAEEIEDARVEGINLRETSSDRLQQRMKTSGISDAARFPDRAAFEQSERRLDQAAGLAERQQALSERQFEEVTKEIADLSTALDSINVRQAKRQEAEALQPTSEQMSMVEAGEFNPFPGEGQIGGLFREGGTGKEGVFGKKKITTEDKRAQAVVNKLFDTQGGQAALEEIKADGVTEQELFAVMRKMGVDKKSALRKLKISEDDINRDLSA